MMKKLLTLWILLLLCSISDAQVSAIAEAKNGVIWFAVEDRLFQILPDGNIKPGGLDVNHTIAALAIDPLGQLLIGTEQGLLVCKDSCKPDTRVPAGPVRSMSVAPDGTIWISTEKDVMKVESFGKLNRPYTNRAEALTIDHQGEVWIGSGHELIRWNDGKTEVFTLPPPPPNVRMRPPITSILATKQGQIYVGTHMGLLLLAGKKFREVSELEVLSLLEDSNGNLWVGTTDGLGKMTKGQWIQVPLPQ